MVYEHLPNRYSSWQYQSCLHYLDLQRELQDSSCLRSCRKRNPHAVLAQLSIFRFWKSTKHCVGLYCLQGFPEFILEDSPYILQIEFLFLLSHAGMWQIPIELYIWLSLAPHLKCNIFCALSSFMLILTLSIFLPFQYADYTNLEASAAF